MPPPENLCITLTFEFVTLETYSYWSDCGKYLCKFRFKSLVVQELSCSQDSCVHRSRLTLTIDREFEFYEFFSFLKFSEFYEFFLFLKFREFYEFFFR